LRIFLENIKVPSVNHYLKKSRYGFYQTRETKDFKKLIFLTGKSQNLDPLEGNVQINIKWEVKRKADLDNILKCVLDALQGVAYIDDKQVIEINAKKLPCKGYETLEIEVKEAL
jgi:crossover junction endodeoxyribonuclease RusA